MNNAALLTPQLMLIINYLYANADFLIGTVSGFVCALLLAYWRYKGHSPKLCNQASTQYQEQITLLKTTLSNLESENQHADMQLAVMNERLSKLAELENSVEGFQQQKMILDQQLKEETVERIQAQQKALYLTDVEARLKKQHHATEQLNQQLLALKANEAKLTTLLGEERKQSEEKLEILQQTEMHLSQRFENLANKIMDEKAKTFTEQNQTNIQGILSPLKRTNRGF